MLDDKIAFVTGGAQGIGKHACLTLAKAGAKIAVVDINTENTLSTASELEIITDVIPITADVRNEDEVEAAIQQSSNKFGGLDILINNAGIVPHFRWGLPRWPNIENMPEDFWDNVIRTNLYGTYLTTKHAIPLMKSKQSGHVINLFGGGGPNPPGALAYMVTKNGIRTFSRYMAEEVRADNICVVTFSPRYAIATEDASDEAKRRMPAPDVLEQAFVLVSELGMEYSGKCVAYENQTIVLEKPMEG